MNRLALAAISAVVAVLLLTPWWVKPMVAGIGVIEQWIRRRARTDP